MEIYTLHKFIPMIFTSLKSISINQTNACPWVYESVPTGNVVLLSLLGLTTGSCTLGDQSLISNWRWFWRHVYIAIITVCCVLFALLLFFSPSWLGFWHCPRSSHIPCQILSNVSFYFWLTIFVTPCFFCMFLHSFTWRLDVLSYAYFDAILKSQYDLEFLCSGCI